MKKMSIRKDDMVVVLSGKDKGKQGKILEVMPKEGKVVVEKINVVSRHTKPRKQGDQGGILKKEAPIYASKVQRVCPKCGKPTRAAHKVQADGKKVRICKKCGAEI
ncbi:50S ribosomal protein L24 [uncultured Flavonifractor sp.]|uniref:50S ribosomal protein L24 n=1 Tax=uncultured Flavonifractor sp. TaxID=1193534 RepID=UPI0025CF9CB5|nr:50S ribosomal protein L24 [uncultured Flavonifractor sp.]